MQFLIKEIKVTKDEAMEFMRSVTDGGYAKIVVSKPETLYAWK